MTIHTLKEVIDILKEKSIPLKVERKIPTIEEVKEIEKEIERSLPEDLKEMLLNTSHVYYGYIEQPVATPKTSRCYLTATAQLGWEQGVPSTWLPFCYDDGDYFCFNENNNIVFWSHNGPSDEKWKNLAHWIEEVWIGEA